MEYRVRIQRTEAQEVPVEVITSERNVHVYYAENIRTKERVKYLVERKADNYVVATFDDLQSAVMLAARWNARKKPTSDTLLDEEVET